MKGVKIEVWFGTNTVGLMYGCMDWRWIIYPDDGEVR